MLPTLSPQEFVDKWRKATLKERSAAQEHFIDLCHLVGHPTPAEADPTGQTFTFEAGATKQRGGQAGARDPGRRGWRAGALVRHLRFPVERTERALPTVRVA
jgi:hypothetical protein